MKYAICELCGSNLDLGEKCDCQTEENKKQERMRLYVEKFFSSDGNGQMSFGGMISERKE